MTKKTPMRLLPAINIKLTPEQQAQLQPYVGPILAAFKQNEPGMVVGQAISMDAPNKELNAITFRFFPNVIAKQMIKATTPILDPELAPKELIVVTQEELDAQAADLARLHTAANEWKQRAETAEAERDELKRQRANLDRAMLRYIDYVELQNFHGHTVKHFMDWLSTDWRDITEAEIRGLAFLDADS